MTTEPIVLDTSVLIKWFRQEEVLAADALRWRDRYLQGEVNVALPALSAYELANVLRYKNELTTAQVQLAVQSLYDMAFQWVPPTEEIISRSIEVARSCNITVYDAAFVATAEAMHGVLITADERLCRQVPDSRHIQLLGSQI